MCSPCSSKAATHMGRTDMRMEGRKCKQTMLPGGNGVYTILTAVDREVERRAVMLAPRMLRQEDHCWHCEFKVSLNYSEILFQQERQTDTVKQPPRWQRNDPGSELLKSSSIVICWWPWALPLFFLFAVLFLCDFEFSLFCFLICPFADSESSIMDPFSLHIPPCWPYLLMAWKICCWWLICSPELVESQTLVPPASPVLISGPWHLLLTLPRMFPPSVNSGPPLGPSSSGSPHYFTQVLFRPLPLT